MTAFSLTARLIDIEARTIRPVTLHVDNGAIRAIEDAPHATPSICILPGFVDAHVHIESSMLTPAQFARLAVVHGTVSTVSDPHEIGNVLGVEGVEWMIENSRQVPFKFCFGAPSCVPATTFETSGATITPDDVRYLLESYPEIGYLAEVMNFPGVLHGDPDMMAKIAIAKQLQKPIDGHAPGLRGDDARRYIEAGPQTDHECFTADEALDKLKYGMKILIREGSAAKNFEALINLLPEHYPNIMFCSDDKHPDNLVEGHINLLVKRALAKSMDLFQVLQAACTNPVHHYRLPVGQLKVGDAADFIVIDNPQNFNILQTYLNGTLVADQGRSLLPSIIAVPINQFNCSPKLPSDFLLQSAQEAAIVQVIEALDGQLITLKQQATLPVVNGNIQADVSQDVLKIAVVNRYQDEKPAVAFIKNIGLKQGAIASCVAHDSHNIVVVGVDEDSICEAVNLIIEAQGGVSAVGNGQKRVVPLPIAGILSGEDGYKVADQYATIDQFVKQKLQTTMTSPFMTLSFMALLVIPRLKLSDLGLFDGESFQFTQVVV
ncbi:MAG: adenine deaminase [Spirosomataceae bacterium]